jgi:hypothetical protein
VLVCFTGAFLLEAPCTVLGLVDLAAVLFFTACCVVAAVFFFDEVCLYTEGLSVELTPVFCVVCAFVIVAIIKNPAIKDNIILVIVFDLSDCYCA